MGGLVAVRLNAFRDLFGQAVRREFLEFLKRGGSAV